MQTIIFILILFFVAVAIKALKNATIHTKSEASQLNQHRHGNQFVRYSGSRKKKNK